VNSVFAFATSFFVTLIILPRLAHIASQIGLVDHPDARKIHNNPEPLIGGIGMAVGLVMSGLLFIPLANMRGFWAGFFTLFVIGVLDDFKVVNYGWRFAAQIAASFFMIYLSRTTLGTFGDLFSYGPVNLGVLMFPASVFCTVGVINAFNMIDGMDGLAGGISFIALISFAILAQINGQTELMLLSLALCGATAAFIRYNWHPSALFMGDVGSLTLGFALAFLSIAVTQKTGSLVPPIAALLVLAVPIVDAVAVMTRRMMQGRSPFDADKNHIHHHLLDLGFCKRNTIRSILILSTVLSAVAILGTLWRVPDYYLVSIFFSFALAHFVFSFKIKSMAKYKAGMGERGMPLGYRLIEKMGFLSRIDRVTALLNRRALDDNLACEFETAKA